MKVVCYRYLIVILSRVFQEGDPNGHWKMGQIGAFFADRDMMGDNKDDREKQISDIRSQSRDRLFDFIGIIIEAQVSVDLTQAVDKTETVIALHERDLAGRADIRVDQLY